MFKRIVTSIAFAFAVSSGTSQDVSARELRLAPGAPPAHVIYDPLYKTFAERLAAESNGRLTGRILGPEVADLRQMRSALRHQVAEVGFIVLFYFPADFPSTNLTGALALLGRNPQAMAAAVTEYVATCEDCQEEFKKFGAVYTGSGSSDIYRILGHKPFRTLDDLRGARLRAASAPYARWAEAVGAVPVNLQIGDTFEALSQRTIDGNITTINDLISFRLVDVVSHVTNIALGTQHTVSSVSIALPVWESLSVEDRKAVIRAATQANPLFTEAWVSRMPKRAKEAAKKAGIEFVEPSPELVQFTKEYAEKHIDLAITAATRNGIQNARSKIERFRGLIGKWERIAEENGGEPQAMADAVQREIWDKIDYQTYGL